MFIQINKLANTSITLDVYTLSVSEFREVEDILSSFRLGFSQNPIASDNKGRRGKRFEIDPASSSVFESEMNLEFRNGIPHFGMSGKPFKCKEISRRDGKGCKTIYAKNIKAARLICSMYVAPENGWFSAYPEKGKCKKRGFWG